MTTNTETIFVVTTTILIGTLLVRLLYFFYKSRTLSNGEILIAVRSKGNFSLVGGLAVSILLGGLAATVIFTGIFREIYHQPLNITAWTLLIEISLFFGILAFIIYKRRNDPDYIQFTERGIDLYHELFPWNEIDGIEWQSPKKLFGLIIGYKKDISKGTFLLLRSGYRWRRFNHPFDAEEKHTVDEILRIKGKIAL